MVILGLPDNMITLRPYTLLWRWLFLLERQWLLFALRRDALTIQHVGSTAIPGMPAKPILDILVVIADFERAAPCIHRLELVGYTYQGENDYLRQYHFIKGQPQTHSLDLVERQGTGVEAKTCFRDYLIQHPEAAREYAALKQQLARQFPTNPVAYQQGKRGFIRHVLQRAGRTHQP